jgi:hypothetical protein
MWPSLWKIQYTELKLSCGNDPVVKISIYSNGDLDLWPNDPKINRVLPLPNGNHVAKFGKDPIYRTKVIVRKPVWTPAIPNHIIRPVSRRAYKKYVNNVCKKANKGIRFLSRNVSTSSTFVKEQAHKSLIRHSFEYFVLHINHPRALGEDGSIGTIAC